MAVCRRRRSLLSERHCRTADDPPYDGAHVYPVDVIPYMLDVGIIVLDDIKFGLRPRRTDSIDKLQRFAEIMRACVREACNTCRVKRARCRHTREELPSEIYWLDDHGGSNCVVLDAIHVSERRARRHTYKDYIP